MSRYVIELRPDCKVVQQICESDGQVSIGAKSIEYFEELNSDYIKENYESLLDEFYQRGLEEGKKAFDLLESEHNSEYERGLHEGNDIGYKDGFEDGKAQSERGCEGCKYEGKVVTGQPCISCCNSYKNQWTAKDDKIEVRDEVVWTEDENVVIVVTCVYTENDIEWCDGICRDGKAYSILTENARKTGRHFDIASILEDMRHD